MIVGGEIAGAALRGLVVDTRRLDEAAGAVGLAASDKALLRRAGISNRDTSERVCHEIQSVRSAPIPKQNNSLPAVPGTNPHVCGPSVKSSARGIIMRPSNGLGACVGFGDHPRASCWSFSWPATTVSWADEAHDSWRPDLGIGLLLLPV